VSALVIVGAGSAGCVIAARVTERSEREVVLLEAGPDYHPAPIPNDLADGRHSSMLAHDWGYRHRPTVGQLLFPLPRGKVVGGSSAVNTCVALRGQPQDFDAWAARGLPDWSWRACLPAFRRLERDLDFPGGEHHGADGPLPIRRHTEDELAPWQAAFLQACRRLGFPECPDANAPGSHGAGPHPMNRIDGRRISAAEAFLTPEVRARKNLRIAARTLVHRVLFAGRRVRGLEVHDERGVREIEATEVVLAAGAINTPAILLRSGIGPRDELERLGSPVVSVVSAVGARLLDHPGTAIFLRPRFGSGFTRAAPLLQTVLHYASEGSAHPTDMQLQPGSKVAFPRFTLPLVSIMCAVNKPRGTGKLRFVSRDPSAKPHIDSLLLEDPSDRAQAVQAMQLAAELVRTPELGALAAFFWPSEKTLRDAQRVDAWIRRSCDSGYHPCGTVPMGSDDDPDAATDGRGRVRGVEGLVVADASLMPTIPAANIHLAVLMIGERFGEWLRHDPG
jgi:choline dehydrogenase